MPRTALIYIFPAAVVAANWLRLEHPHGSGQHALWIMLLALCPALVRRRAALVYVDPASFANGSAPRRPEPALLRLQAAGVPVAVLRRGDDLAVALGEPAAREAARA